MKKILTITLLMIVTGAAVLMLSEFRSQGLPISAELLMDDPVELAIDGALYRKTSLIGRQVDFPLPTAEAEKNLQELANINPSEPRFLKELADVQVALSRLDDAEATMKKLAENHPDQVLGLQDLAAYYHGRLEINKENRTLREIADKQNGAEKISTLRGILALKKDFLLPDINHIAILREIVAIEPEKYSYRAELITELIILQNYDDALREIDSAAQEFPNQRSNFIAQKAGIYRDQGKPEEALALFDIDFHPVNDVALFNNYVMILRSLDRYVQFERDLNRRARLQQLDERGFQRHFLLMRTQRKFNDAEKTLDRWALSLGDNASGRMNAFIGSYDAIGKTDKAWKWAYSRYLVATDVRTREEAHADLASYTADLGNRNQAFAAHGVATFFTLKNFDSSPGIAGGLLSLLYNDQQMNWRIDDLLSTSRDYENKKRFLNLFDQFRNQYPQSDKLASLFAKAIKLLNDYHRPEDSLKLAEQFMNSYPEDGRYTLVAEAAIRSMEMLKRDDRIEALYKELIGRADMRAEKDEYFRLLSQLTRHYTDKKNPEGVISLYWDQITAHPKDEILYQRFLDYLATHRIYAEELKVYQRAIENFDDRSYYDKIARWYIRQKRNTDFQELTRKIADIFSESELHDYFQKHLRTAKNSADADSQLYRTMYEYANRRFPRNLKFVRSLLNYYSRFKIWDEFETMSLNYFYADDTVRKNLLRRLSKQKKLMTMLDQIPEAKDLAQSIESADQGRDLPQSPAEVLFLAESARWYSYYEAAIPAYQHLADTYTSQIPYAESLASLLRSAGKSHEAEKAYSQLAGLRPINKSYPTKAGEIAVERGDVERAADHWDRILLIAPATPDNYLEVASIWWDYYQFDRSAETIISARQRLGQPALYGSKLAAVYESAGNYQSAIEEYIHTAVLNYDDYYLREEPMDRLTYLATRRAMDDEVFTGFEEAIESDGSDYRNAQAYNMFLQRVENRPLRLQVLAASINRYQKRDYLNWLISEFRGLRSPDYEEASIKRLIEIEGESVSNLFRLADLYERNNRVDLAIDTMHKRVNMTQTDEPEAVGDYINALNDIANMAWRHERFDYAYRWWEMAGRAARGLQGNNMLQALANRYISKKRYPEASALLEELLEKNPSSASLFNNLARIYSDREDYQGLTELYRRGIDAVRKDSALNSDGKKYRISQLRFGLIDSLSQLEEWTAALDQYIELINDDFNNETTLETAYRFAVVHSLVERLQDYYVRTSGKSFKDYRWNTVLARLYSLQNDLEASAQQWRKAIANEPQRTTLRSALADAYLKLQQFPEAVEQYREIYRLDQKNSYWLRTIARTQALSGSLDQAKETLESILEESPHYYSNYFEIARFLVEWGDLDAASEKMEQGLTVLTEDIYKQRLTKPDLDLYVETEVRRGKVVEVFDRLLTINSIYTAEGNRKNNNRAWQARQGQQLSYNSFGGSFADAVRLYADSSKLPALAARLESFLDPTNKTIATVNWVLWTAQSCDLAVVAERSLTERFTLMAGQFKTFDVDNTFSSSLEYYRQKGMWSEATAVLEREIARNPAQSYSHLLLRSLADIYHYADNNENEFKTLNRYWQGSLKNTPNFNNQDQYIERYLDQLLTRNRDAELLAVAGKPGNYSGQIINTFLAQQRPDLAVKAIDALSMSFKPKWRSSKKLLINIHAGLPEAELGTTVSPTDLMDAKPVSRRIAAKPDMDRTLVGEEWYAFLPHYADYLLKNGEAGLFRKYIAGVAEESPRNSETQRSIGRWYRGHELWDDALKHFNLALQLNDKDPRTIAEIGNLYYRKGDKAQAMSEWRKILAGEPGPNQYRVYFETLAENNLFDEASTAMGTFINQLTGSSNWNYVSLVEEYAQMMNDKDLGDVVVNQVLTRAGTFDNPVPFLSSMYSSLPLLPSRKAELLNALIAGAKGQDDGSASNSEGHSETMYKTWLEEGIEFAMGEKLYSIAKDWLDQYETANYPENPSWRIGSTENFYLKKGEAEIFLGNKAAAMEAFEQSLKDIDYYNAGRHQAVYAILKRAGAEKEASDLMINFYRNAMNDGVQIDAYYTGLANFLLEKSSAGEALALLDRYINLSSDSASRLREAINLLEKSALAAARERALEYRRALLNLAPFNYENMVSLAVDLSMSEREESLRLFRKVFSDPGVSNYLKGHAVDDYAKLFENNPVEARAESQKYAANQNNSEVYTLLVARLSSDDAVSEDQMLATAQNNFQEPALILQRRAGLAVQSGESEQAISHLYASLRFERSSPVFAKLFTLLHGQNRHAEVLLLFDNFSNMGLQAAQRDDVSALTGYTGEELMVALSKLVDSAVAIKEYGVAMQYEQIRVALADDLTIDIKDRLDELLELMEKNKAAEPPIRIIEAIAN